jgi:hypothetical protein
VTVLDERPAVLGTTTPRLWTKPQVTGPPGLCGCGCALTPSTSLGFEVIAFAEDVLGEELLPWQRWWLIHALELRPDGRFRFTIVLTLISRQNGKTFLLKIVSLWFLYVESHRIPHEVLVLGAAQDLRIAKESWSAAVAMARRTPELDAEIPRNGVRYANGEQTLNLDNGGRYVITATTRSAGRGLSTDLLMLDELREHRTTEAWAALSNTTMARPNALTLGISNQGDGESVVLNDLRSAALAENDDTLALFEWSAPDGCEATDLAAWAQANPALGHGSPPRLTLAKLRSAHAVAKPSDWRTENLCQRVDALDAAVDPQAWAACADPAGTLAGVRERVAVCVDVAPDGRHVTLAGAAQLDDGSVRVEVLGAWSSTNAARADLPGLLAAISPAVTGWFPAGPAAVLGPDLPDEATALSGAAVTAACQSLADLVQARRVLHPDDPLLNAHVAGAQRLVSGDGWRFSRRGAGHVDAAYALAGAVQLARTLAAPAVLPRPWAY